jgi:glucokinase
MHSAPSLTLAFDIGGTNLRAALVDDDGHVVGDETAPSGRAPPEEIAARASALASSLEARAGARATGAGVGIAAMVPLPGDVIENAPNLGWRNAPFRTLLSRALDDRPVVMVNDLDAIALGEQHAGAARGHPHVLFVFVGTGVGAGIVVEGELLRGARGVAAELGHIKVVARGGRLCGCGAHGCLEAYTGGGPLVAHLDELVARAPQSALAERARTSGGPNLSHVDELAREGEHAMHALVEEVSDLLALAIANCITVLNPGVLVLGGGVLARCTHLKARVVEKTRSFANGPAVQGLLVVDGMLGDRAGLIGAARAFRRGHST